ncbi:MAG TPA: hypothetical protein PKM25_01005 [Candidatus Ozemobacteraceae bacterium]|nr:hypothetical protein [Candidatus Ozemobacteraceae bacterium]
MKPRRSAAQGACTAAAIFWLLFIFGICSASAATKYRISMINGTWLMNITTVLIQAEIDGKTEIICLPRVEFSSDIDRDEIKKRLREGIKKQDAVFHIYHDELNRPIKSGNVLFASDIFLKSLKMSYFSTLREWGYRFKVSRQPPFEDRTYVQDVQSQGFLEMSSSLKTGQKSPGDSSSGAGDRSAAADGSGVSTPAGSGGGSMSIAHLLPAGYLPPEVRKMKKELDRKIREIKTRPFKAEVISVDPVRWAGGRMGIMRPDGTATGCVIEGRSVTVRLPVPAKADWLNPAISAALASQPCEFILQRDTNGRELRRNDAYILADLYLTETGLTWNDWLQSQGAPAAVQPADPAFATAPVTLKIQVVNGRWQGLKAPALGSVAFEGALPAGVSGTEIIRVPPAEQPVPDFRTYSAKLAASAPLQEPINVTLLLFPDGSPYEEMGQRRAQRIFFPRTQATLLMLMNAATKP